MKMSSCHKKVLLSKQQQVLSSIFTLLTKTSHPRNFCLKVDCYVSRPEEKSVMLYFMFYLTAGCILLAFCEATTLIFRYIRDWIQTQKIQGILKKDKLKILMLVIKSFPGVREKFHGVNTI